MDVGHTFGDLLLEISEQKVKTAKNMELGNYAHDRGANEQLIVNN